MTDRLRNATHGVSICVLVSSVWLGGGFAGAATLQVPEDYPTIQMAIDVAVPGDSVAVGPGTWTGEVRVVGACGNTVPTHAVLFLKPGVTVVSTEGPGMTVLDGGIQGQFSVNTIFMSNVSGSGAWVDGFTVTGGGDAVEIGCSEALAGVRNCWFIENLDNAISLRDASLRMEDCVVARNGFGFDGDGRAVEAFSSDLEVVRTRFEENASTALLVQGPNATLSVVDSEFVDHANGRAVSLSGVSEAVISRSLFFENRIRSSRDGGAIFVGTSTADISFCTFARDSAVTGNGGAIAVSPGATASITNNTFFECDGSYGAAVAAFGPVLVARNAIARSAGRALVASPPDVVQDGTGCNVMWNDQNYFQWPAEASATDILADPEFCDALVGDYTVRPSSPCLPENNDGCGQIGAHGVGCGSVAVEPESWGGIKALFRTSP